MRIRSTIRMKLLIISARLPRSQSGSSARNYHLLKALAQDHTASLLTFVDNAEAEASEDLALLKAFTHHLILIPRQPQRAKRWRQLLSVLQGRSYLLNQYINPEMQKAFDALLVRDHYDAVLFE